MQQSRFCTQANVDAAHIGKLRTVEIVIYPGFKAIEAVELINVFDYANTQLVSLKRPPFYDLRIVSTVTGTIQSDTLIALQATKTLSKYDLPDIAIVVGARQIETALKTVPEIVDWVRNVSHRLARLVSLCSGSFFLADAGVLDHKRAATHWSVSDLLQTRYPRVKVDSDAIFIKEGHIWTSAGVTAGIDLALAMVEEDLGRDIALAVARDLVVYLKRPGGQSQFSTHLGSQMINHPTIRELQDWILQNLDHKFVIPDMAKRVAMSERNFTRLFTRETGHAPAQFIETARFELARRLLEDIGLPLKSIAARSGFSSDDHMRRVFQRRLGVSPSAYRERFGTSGVELRTHRSSASASLISPA